MNTGDISRMHKQLLSYCDQLVRELEKREELFWEERPWTWKVVGIKIARPNLEEESQSNHVAILCFCNKIVSALDDLQLLSKNDMPPSQESLFEVGQIARVFKKKVVDKSK